MSINYPARRRAARYRDMAKEERDKYRSGMRPVACGKVCYPSKSEAKSSVRRVLGDGTLWGKELMSHYWCVKCDAWNIGHRRTEARVSDGVVS
jgi:hypothetical protein